jgi:hypothetical protein
MMMARLTVKNICDVDTTPESNGTWIPLEPAHHIKYHDTCNKKTDE